MGKCVGAVGRDLDVEDDIASGEDRVDGRADFRRAGKEEETGGVLGERELLGGAHHAGGRLAANGGLLDDEVAGEDGAGQGDGHAVAGVAVGRAADDGSHAAVGGADVHGADGELVGVGVFVAGEDVADDDVVKCRGAGANDLFDLEAEEGDGAGDVVVGDAGEINVVLEPGAGEFHFKRRGSGSLGHRVHRARTRSSQSQNLEHFGRVWTPCPPCRRSVFSVSKMNYFRRIGGGIGRRFGRTCGCRLCRRGAWRGARGPCRRRSHSRPRGHNPRP